MPVFADPMEMLGSLGALSIVILLTLMIFSIASWAIIVHKWRRFRVVDDAEAAFLASYQQRTVQEYPALCNEAEQFDNSPSAAVFLGVMDRIPSGSELYNTQANLAHGANSGGFPNRHYLEKVTQHIIQNHISLLEAYLPFLATTGNITPFIGLLGTVLGIVSAFQEIGVQGSASIASVAPGVAEALIATAAGLFAAIPAVIAYNYFLAKMRKTVFCVEAFGIEFLNSVEQLKQDATEPIEVGR